MPPLAPFVFVDLDYTTDKAQEMHASVSVDDYRELLICSYQTADVHEGLALETTTPFIDQ